MTLELTIILTVQTDSMHTSHETLSPYTTPQSREVGAIIHERESDKDPALEGAVLGSDPEPAI